MRTWGKATITRLVAFAVVATVALPRAALAVTAAAAPATAGTWTEQGQKYVRRAYETGDPAFYALAQNSLDRAAALVAKRRSDPVPVALGRAGLALARHDFRGALRLADEVLHTRPDSVDALIARTDADVELGHYDEAASDVDTLIDHRPGVAALARLSYVRQLSGDLPGAIVAMRQAVASVSQAGFDRAVTRAYLGDTLLENGNLAGATRAYEQALTDAPQLPIAQIGRARVLHAGGRNGDAIALLRTLTARYPAPGALILLSDLQSTTGDRAGAADTDQLVRATEALFEANGADVDVEMAVFEADRDSQQALRLAERAYRTRRTIFTADALGWALLAAGRPADALRYAEEAVRSAPAVGSVHYHAAAVLAATGRRARAATELRLAARNPWFSVSQSANAARLAHQLDVVWPDPQGTP